MLRECVPDDVQTGGASVVVRGREGRSHGEGRQLKAVAQNHRQRGYSILFKNLRIDFGQSE
jgi:hypothetical protein